MDARAVEAGPLTVAELLSALRERLGLVVLEGSDRLAREVASPTIQKPGLVLAGFEEYFHPERIQVLGRSEIRWLGESDLGTRGVIARLCSTRVPAFLVTRGLEPPGWFRECCREQGLVLLVSPLPTAEVIEVLLHYLSVRLAPSVRLHGVLVDLFGLGVLITGESGIGKSECALELLARGHRLVADDSVIVRLVDGDLIGHAPELGRNYIEVRGLGILNVRDLFGVTAVRELKVVEQVVHLYHPGPDDRIDRLGQERRTRTLLGKTLPLVEMPVAPGRNVAVLLEVAARRQLLLERGKDASLEMQASVLRQIEKGRRRLAGEGEERR